jgi:DNA-binding CsgD family transcriptional regulator
MLQSTHAPVDIPETPDLDPDLDGARVLVVEPEPELALAFGAHLARAGADALVVRDLDGARREIAFAEHDFDGVVADLDEDPVLAARILGGLRARPIPCFGVGLTSRPNPDDARSLLLRGALEILAAAGRAVRASEQLRSYLRSHAQDRPLRRPRHRSQFESCARRVTFELQGSVAALARRIKLSPREKSVLGLVAGGYRYDEVAKELGMATRTVKMHVANIRTKADVSSRHELVRRVLGTAT